MGRRPVQSLSACTRVHFTFLTVRAVREIITLPRYLEVVCYNQNKKRVTQQNFTPAFSVKIIYYLFVLTRLEDVMFP